MAQYHLEGGSPVVGAYEVDLVGNDELHVLYPAGAVPQEGVELLCGGDDYVVAPEPLVGGVVVARGGRDPYSEGLPLLELAVLLLGQGLQGDEVNGLAALPEKLVHHNYLAHESLSAGRRYRQDKVLSLKNTALQSLGLGRVKLLYASVLDDFLYPLVYLEFIDLHGNQKPYRWPG